MILRILQILIVLSWVTTTAMLLNRTFRTDESRFPRVDPHLVAQRFFESREHADLILIREEKMVGRLSVTPRDPRGWSIDDAPFGEGIREIFISLRIALDAEEDPAWWSRVESYGSLFLDTAYHLNSIRFQAHLPRSRASAQIGARLDPFHLGYQIRQGEEVLLDSNRPELAREWLGSVKAMGTMMGLDTSVLEGLEDPEALMAGAGPALVRELMPSIDCRHGRFRIFEGRYHGYILALEWGNEARLRFYFSEMGELLRIEGVPGLAILAETFVPLSMFQEPGFETGEDAMIEIDDLRMTYGSLVALDRLNLKVPPGELFAFLGPNGAGKTTTIKLLTGLLRPTSGRARICGFDIQKDPIEAKRRIGFIPDVALFYDKLTTLEFMQFTAELFEIDADRARTATETLFEQFSLEGFAHQLVENLSHGTRQRLAIASALMHDPEVIIIDEPMVGLDPHNARVVKDELKARSRAGATVFMSTHLLNVAEELADRVGIIHEGRLLRAATVPELREHRAEDDWNLEEFFLELTR